MDGLACSEGAEPAAGSGCLPAASAVFAGAVSVREGGGSPGASAGCGGKPDPPGIFSSGSPAFRQRAGNGGYKVYWNSGAVYRGSQNADDFVLRPDACPGSFVCSFGARQKGRHRERGTGRASADSVSAGRTSAGKTAFVNDDPHDRTKLRKSFSLCLEAGEGLW